MNSRRGRVGKEIAHTLTTSCDQGYYAMCIDMNPDPKVTELARCITSRQDSGIGHHKGEKSGVILVTEPIAVLTPANEAVRQQGRRFKLPDEPMFTITVTTDTALFTADISESLCRWSAGGCRALQMSSLKGSKPQECPMHSFTSKQEMP